ncbi:type IV pilus biogenesis protein PilM [Pseudomonas taetrolens]|uniref:type IV pilus biogenesis protein PilM n=1 Tax=Pseudomonas taetrolens TaxID=47884 RepID=UPI0037CBF7C1
MSGLFFETRPRYVGVHISGQSIKVVELSRMGNTFELHAYAIEPLSADYVDDLTSTGAKSVAQVLRRALGNTGVMARDAVTALPDTQVICKTLEVETGLSENELELYVRLEAEQYVPYALEEMALDYDVQEVVPRHSDQVEIVLVACRQEVLEWHQEVLLSAGLKPHVIDVQALALVRGLDWMLRSVTGSSAREAVAVADFSPPLARLSIVSQSRVIYCHEWLFERGSLGDDAFKFAAVEHLGREIGLSAESAVGAKVGLIVLAGAAASSTGLSQWVEARLGIPTRVADPFAAMKLNPALAPEALFCDAPVLLAACGLALRGFD